MAGRHPAAQSVQVCREALFAPDGHPVMAAEYNGGRRSLKIKMREFLSFLKGISMPGTDKNTLVSRLLAFRSRTTTENSIQIAAPMPLGLRKAQTMRQKQESPGLPRLIPLKRQR